MKKLRLSCVLLVCILVFTNIMPAFSVSDRYTEISEPIQSDYSNELNKLHFYFDLNQTDHSNSGIMTLSNNTNSQYDYSYIDDEGELYRAVENMNSFCDGYAQNEPVQMTVEFKSEYNKTPEFIKLSEKIDSVKSIEDVRALRRELNAFSKQFHRQENEKNIEQLGQFEAENISIIDYAPFVVMEMNRDDIQANNLVQLAHSDEVVNISLNLENEYVETGIATSWTNALKETTLYSTVSSGLHTGQGARIGILEAEGVCDVSHKNLRDKNITVDERCTKISDHATQVTSVAALIAPDAEFFVSDTDNAGLSWFIDNDCDIVNCSFGYPLCVDSDKDNRFEYIGTKYRYDVDRLFDYQIIANKISVVVAAGNKSTDNTTIKYNPYGEITSPGLAHNCITVGGLERKLGFLESYVEHAEGAAYVAPTSYVKPEISAIYNLNVPNIGAVSGTSFAAPQVTGAIALLLEKGHDLSTTPEVIRSTLISTANKTKDYSATVGNFDERVGAGCLDFEEIRTFSKNGHLSYKVLSPQQNFPDSLFLSDEIQLSKNNELQVSIVWDVPPDDVYGNTYVTDFDLCLYNSNGDLVYESNIDATSGVEFIRYKAPSAGTYKLCVYQIGDRKTDIGTHEIIAYTYFVN